MHSFDLVVAVMQTAAAVTVNRHRRPNRHRHRHRHLQVQHHPAVWVTDKVMAVVATAVVATAATTSMSWAGRLSWTLKVGLSLVGLGVAALADCCNACDRLYATAGSLGKKRPRSRLERMAAGHNA